MELKELTEKTLKLFETESADQLGQRLLEACKGTDKLEAFSNLVDGDLTQDWMQKIMYLNNEENRVLAEFRDALLNDLMSGKIEVTT